MASGLVVYYSRIGHTRTLAEAIAKRSGWTLAEIVDPSNRAGKFGYLRCGFEVITGVKPRIQYAGPNPAEFDVVVIGGPVWAAHVASPLRAFLAQYSDQLRSIALFCTFGGADSDKALAEASALAHKTPLDTLAVTERELAESTYPDRVATFVKNVTRASSKR